jgi:uracil-DNA glycosylase family 4
MNRYQLLVEDWKDCRRCDLAATRKRVVFGRGKLPADVVFIGEAPGPSEDVTGKAFDGPAGDKFDELIHRAWGVKWSEDYAPMRLFFTNLVGCIPWLPDRSKWEAPDHDAVMACKPRLEALVEMAAPRLIVFVGRPAREYLDQTWRDAPRLPAGVPAVEIKHPSAVLRAQTANRSLLAQQIVVALRDAKDRYLS